MNIEPAQAHEIETVLALSEELLTELGDEGQEFAGIDQERFHLDVLGNLETGRFTALLARGETGTAVGILTLSESFALFAGGEHGVID